jgi:hypothetical protein
MSGTSAGGRKAAETRKAKYPDGPHSLQAAGAKGGRARSSNKSQASGSHRKMSDANRQGDNRSKSGSRGSQDDDNR